MLYISATLTLTLSHSQQPYMQESMDIQDELRNFLKSWATILATLTYSYFISSNLPKGFPRFLSLLPVFSLYILLPLSLSRPLFSGFLSGFISFLANFKLLHFSFTDENPLSSQNTLLGFILFTALPIKIKDKKHPRKNESLPLSLGFKGLICGFLLLVYEKLLDRNLVVFCCWMYLFNDVALTCCATCVGWVLGVDLDPPSDEPYVASSLSDFWGRRWNCMVSDALRRTVSHPVRAFWAGFMGRDLAHGLAVMVTFVVSGLMHEMVFYHVTRVRPTWEVTWFFVLHGVCVVLEGVVGSRYTYRWRMTWAVTCPLTLGFVVGSGYWLFFPQVRRSGVDVRVMEDVVVVGKYFWDVLVNLCRVVKNLGSGH